MYKYHRLSWEYNKDVHTLNIYQDDIVLLLSIPFSINNDTLHKFTCDICELRGTCRSPILGTTKHFRDFCLAGPPHSYPDLKIIGITGYNFNKRLKKAKIIKKLPKPKKI